MDETPDQSAERFSLDDLQKQRRQIDETIRKFKRQVAVMFTDVKGSTSYYEQHGDLAGHALVARFTDVVQAAIEPHGGTIVKAAGDGLLVCFESPVEATRSALKLYEELDKHNNNEAVDEAERLDARTAIHFGTSLVDEEEGDLKDVFGDTVNTTARLSDMAKDYCDLVVSRSVADKLLEAEGITVLEPFEQPARGKAAPLAAYPVAIPGREVRTPDPAELAAARAEGAAQQKWVKYMAPAAAAVAVLAIVIALTGRGGTPATPPGGQAGGPGQVIVVMSDNTQSAVDAAATQAVSGMFNKSAVGPDSKVVVMPFQDPNGGVTQLGVTLARQIQAKLAGKAQAVALTQDNVAQALPGEPQVSFASLTTSSDYQKAARAVPAAYYVKGTLTDSGGGVNLKTELVSAADGKSLSSGAVDLDKKNVEDLWWLVQAAAKGAGGAHAKGAATKLPPLSLHVLAYVEREVNPDDYQFVPIGDRATLQSKDRIQLMVTPTSDCYVYVLFHDSEEKVGRMDYQPEVGEALFCRGGVAREIPQTEDGEGGVWGLDKSIGTETLFLVATYRPIDNMDALKNALKASVAKKPLATAEPAGSGGDDVLLASAAVLSGGMEEAVAEKLGDGGYTVLTRSDRGFTQVMNTRVTYDVHVKGKQAMQQKAKLLTGGGATFVKAFTIFHVAKVDEVEEQGAPL